MAARLLHVVLSQGPPQERNWQLPTLCMAGSIGILRHVRNYSQVTMGGGVRLCRRGCDNARLAIHRSWSGSVRRAPLWLTFALEPWSNYPSRPSRLTIAVLATILAARVRRYRVSATNSAYALLKRLQRHGPHSPNRQLSFFGHQLIRSRTLDDRRDRSPCARRKLRILCDFADHVLAQFSVTFELGLVEELICSRLMWKCEMDRGVDV